MNSFFGQTPLTISFDPTAQERCCHSPKRAKEVCLSAMSPALQAWRLPPCVLQPKCDGLASQTNKIKRQKHSGCHQKIRKEKWAGWHLAGRELIWGSASPDSLPLRDNPCYLRSVVHSFCAPVSSSAEQALIILQHVLWKWMNNQGLPQRTDALKCKSGAMKNTHLWEAGETRSDVSGLVVLMCLRRVCSWRRSCWQKEGALWALWVSVTHKKPPSLSCKVPWDVC